RRSHAGGKTDPVSSILECRQVWLEGRARGIGDARVLVALVDGRRLLYVGGGLIDRRHDGAGRGVRPLPGMDGPCPKPLLRLDLHIPSLVYDKARTHAWRARAANRRWKSDPAARPRSVQVLVARAGCDRFGLILLIRLDIGREERLAHRRGIISTGFHQRLRALQRR